VYLCKVPFDSIYEETAALALEPLPQRMRLIAVYVNLLGDGEAPVVLFNGRFDLFRLITLLIEELVAGEEENAETAFIVLI